MALYFSFLRGVNVAGHKKIAMADLRRMCEQMGLENPRTLLNSGNLIFAAAKRTTTQLERLLEAETKKRLGLDTTYMIRTAAELAKVIADNPFRAEAVRDPGHLLVMFLKGPAGPKEVAALQMAITGPEVVRGNGKNVYITYPNGVGTSRLTSAVIDAKLGTRGTGRNWNTVLKLGTLTSGSI